VDWNLWNHTVKKYGNSEGISKVIYEEGLLNTYEKMRKYLAIYEEVVSHI
jgi:hypothetical protein